MRDESIERIELKIAFLERANNELSDVVYRQQRELTALAERVQALTERVDGLKAEPQLSIEEERPPHY